MKKVKRLNLKEKKHRNSSMGEIKYGNILYQKAKTGKIHQWRAWTNGGEVVVEHGTMGGKLVVNRYMAEPTNVGRANERNAKEQAIFEVESLYKKKLDKKYNDSIEEASEDKYLPMLAHNADIPSKRAKIKFPARVQRKYNGLRCMANWRNQSIFLMSRGNKQYNVHHIEEELAKILPTKDALDGELYNSNLSLQKINSLVKKWKPEESTIIEYHVYDYPYINGKSLVQSKRLAALKKLKEKFKGTHIVYVESYEVNSWEEIEAYEKQFVKEGYEGAIVRDLNGTYEFGNRSNALLKVKTFKDDEFEVVGYDIEKSNINGNEIEAVVWICKNKFKSPDGTYKNFEVRPKGTFIDRAEQLADVQSYIGKKLTVKYFELTPDNIPFHGTGMHFRLDEDLLDES